MFQTKTKCVVLEITDPSSIEKTVNLYLDRHPSVMEIVSVTTFITAKPAAVTQTIQAPNGPQHIPILNVLLVVRVRIEPAQC